MSYILDALKKSSDERLKLQKDQELQGPLSPGSPVKPRAHGQQQSLVVLLLSTILIISVFGWWFFSTSQNSGTPVSDVAPSPSTDIIQTKPQNKMTDRPESSGTNVLEQPAPKQAVTQNTKRVTAEESLEIPESSITKPKTPLQVELPLAIQAQLPEMKYSGHVFSANPQLRMIMINTTVVREGDLVNADLRLMEITGNGLTMSHKGTEFKVVLF